MHMHTHTCHIIVDLQTSCASKHTGCYDLNVSVLFLYKTESPDLSPRVLITFLRYLPGFLSRNYGPRSRCQGRNSKPCRQTPLPVDGGRILHPSVFAPSPVLPWASSPVLPSALLLGLQSRGQFALLLGRLSRDLFVLLLGRQSRGQFALLLGHQFHDQFAVLLGHPSRGQFALLLGRQSCDQFALLLGCSNELSSTV